MVKSKRTKKMIGWGVFFTILHILCVVGPFLYFLPAAFITGAVVSKVVLSLTTITSLILAGMGLFLDIKHRAGLHRGIMWLLVAGIIFCLEAIKPFIWIMAGVSIVDELIFVKLKDHFKTAAATNKEIDKRLSA